MGLGCYIHHMSGDKPVWTWPAALAYIAAVAVLFATNATTVRSLGWYVGLCLGAGAVPWAALVFGRELLANGPVDNERRAAPKRFARYVVGTLFVAPLVLAAL